MTIDEIIKHYEQVLKELKAYREQSGDAISRQAMHIELEKWITYGEYKYSNATKYLYDRIDRLPSVTPQQRTGRWIPVSERLPEENGRYIVYLNTKVFPIRILHFAKNLNEISLDFNCSFKSKKVGWYDYDSENGFFEWTGVEAWMPLPEPYKAESGNKE